VSTQDITARGAAALALGDWLSLAWKVEAAIRDEFGVRTDSVTGRATDGRCVLACAAITHHLVNRGLPARWVAGTLLITRPGCQSVEVGLHAMVVLGTDILFDPSIAQAHRPRFDNALDVDALVIPAPNGVQTGRSVQMSLSDVSIDFMPSDRMTELLAQVPDLEPERVALISAQLN